jgi:hypothetical protein
MGKIRRLPDVRGAAYGQDLLIANRWFERATRTQKGKAIAPDGVPGTV